MGWDTRLAWSGEQPATGKTLLQRFDTVYGSGDDRSLTAEVGPDWEALNYDGTSAGLDTGRWGTFLGFNNNNPATEKTSLRVPNFSGMWPSSGKVVVFAWAALKFSMSFTPIISTRNTDGKAPLVYLSAISDGRPRAMAYSASGGLILDQVETLPWTPTAGHWIFYAQCIDLDAATSQLGAVQRSEGASFVSPVRSMSGTPNKGCEADFEALTLSPTADYWANGWADEAGMFVAGGDFDFAQWIEQVRLSTWARGADSTGGAGLVVSDDHVEATSTATLTTGAEPASWATSPTVEPLSPLVGDPVAFLSDDSGATWSSGITPDGLPASFDGLARWQIPLQQGERFTGLDLIEPHPVPTLDPVATVILPQDGQATVVLSGSWQGTPSFTATATGDLEATVSGTSLTINAGLAIGDFSVTVTVTDNGGETSDPLTIRVEVVADEWAPPDNPVYPRAPLILYDEDDEPVEILTDPVSPKVFNEVNGEQTLTFSVPVGHRKAVWLESERRVDAAGDRYRIRRIETGRDGGVATLQVYAEARFYDLGVAGLVDERDWSGAQAGTVMRHVLKGTGWDVGKVNVATVRSWTMERANVLACLRAIQKVHGGDLVFDNEAKTVSLLQFSGKDQGVAFLSGKGLTDIRRVVDTTTLLTRIVPKNAEGVGIESVNDGVPYLEDFTFSNEVRTGEYHYASGTSPLTMLAMTNANIANRSRPKVSYEAEVADLSAWTGQPVDRFDVGDRVTIIDPELGIQTEQRIVALEYDLLKPWASVITLSEKLRALGSADDAVDSGTLDTGADIDTRDLVPFNLLLNGRFDNGLAHWAASGVSIVDGGATGARSAEFKGSGTRWIEQTVATDTRDAYTLSLQVESEGGPSGWVPDLTADIEITYDDGTSETVGLELF